MPSVDEFRRGDLVTVTWTRGCINSELVVDPGEVVLILKNCQSIVGAIIDVLHHGVPVKIWANDLSLLQRLDEDLSDVSETHDNSASG